MKLIVGVGISVAAGLALGGASTAVRAMPRKVVCRLSAGGQSAYQWDAQAGTLNGRHNGQREPYGIGSYEKYFVNNRFLGRGVYTDKGKLAYEYRIDRTDGKYLFWDPSSNPEGPTPIGECTPLANG